MPDMSATIAAARACASTILFQSIRLQAFRGAVPHVMLVVDRVPCVQQKVLIEGYRQVLDDFNASKGMRTKDGDGAKLPLQTSSSAAADHHSSSAASASEDLFVSLNPAAVTPCGGGGLEPQCAAGECISYSVLPFVADTFLTDMRVLQAFLRQCGEEEKEEKAAAVDGGGGGAAAAPSSRWSDAEFATQYGRISRFLRPLDAVNGGEDAKGEAALEALRHGPKRELLAFILIQQSAFQNEMQRYRLRLTLYDMGARVAEHCHLESMSAAADALVKQGRYREALEHDEVYSYARSCSFPPAAAEVLGKSIADSIDLFSWCRRSSKEGMDGGSSEFDDGNKKVAAVGNYFAAAPSAAFAAALRNEDIWGLFNKGALVWTSGKGEVASSSCGASNGSSDDGEEGDDANDGSHPHHSCSRGAAQYDEVMKMPIVGPGAPLRIVCKDRSHVLEFHGGMEDCLMNTGSYPAASDTERNDVAAHRVRFAINHSVVANAESSHGSGSAAPAEEQKPTPVHGRMKKQEYLAMLKEQGKKPNSKKTKGHKNASSDNDEEEEEEASRPRGSTIATSIGGTFPIGEVISESFDLSKLSGTCHIFAYPDPFKNVAMSKPRPFTMTIEKGVVTDVSENAPDDFVDLLSLVRQTEGDCYVRELGIGLNPYVGLSHILTDVTSFERQWGIHLSLGQRHPLFVKQAKKCNPDGTVASGVTVDGPVLKRKAGKYHIDVFVDAAELRIGSLVVDFTKGIATP